MKKPGRSGKALWIAVCVLVFLAAAGSLGVGGAVAYGVLYQNKGADTRENSWKQLEMWGYDGEAFLEKWQGEEVWAEAEDGNRVPGSFYEGGNERCVILVHGAGGDRISVCPLAEEYLSRGYDVIAIDQRGSGANPDPKVTFGIRESMDVQAMVTYARETLHFQTVFVHGQSMGAQTAALYAARVRRGETGAADAVVLDSPVPGMEWMLKEMFGEGDPESVSASYLTGTGKVVLDLVFGIDYDDGDTVRAAEEIQIPTLVLCSDRDEICSPEMVEKIYENLACRQKAIVHFDSAHIEGLIDEPERYMESVEKFLEYEKRT